MRNRRENEKRLNAYPAFLAKIKNEDGMEFTLHFTALFSTRPDAIPIILSHGWPGCFIEFVPILKLLKEKYTPDTLPSVKVQTSLALAEGYVGTT